MTTTIDELVVVLGLDASQFTEGQKKALDDFKKTKDAAHTTATEMSAAGEVAGQFYGKIKSEALSLIAVLVGANSISKFVGNQVTTLADVARISTVMGQATPDVIAVGMAVGRIGGNAKEAQNAMLGLSQTMERWARFGEASLPFRRAAGFIGASVNDTPLQVLQKFATWSQGKKPQDVELIGTDLGLNQDLINEAIRGRKQFDADIATSYANEPSTADTVEAQKLQTAFGILVQGATAAGRNMLFAADKMFNFAGIMEVIANILSGGKTPTPDVPGDDDLDEEQIQEALADDRSQIKTQAGIIKQDQGGAANAARQAVLAAKRGDAPAAAFWRKQAGDLAADALARQGIIAGLQQQEITDANPWGAKTPAGAAAQSGDVQQLLAAGFTKEQARGILAGIAAEGGGIGQAPHGGFGIGQERGPRKAALLARYGPHPTRSQELAFLIDEMTNPTNPEYQYERTHGFMGFANDTTASATMQDYLTSVMRPGLGLARDLQRGAQALTEINIETINVNAPNAKNAKDIAKGIHKALASQIATQANSGPS